MLRLKKIFLAGMLIFMGCGGFAQGFFDEFADGDFIGGPAIWGGLTTEWEVLAGRLHLNKAAPAANNTSYLSTPSVSIAGAVWEFNVELTANPSGTNYVDVFLVSDRADLSNSPFGYFVRLGNTNDEISLYTANGAAAPVMIIDGPNGLLNVANPIFKVRVTRSASGDWSVFARGTNLAPATPTYTQQGLTVNNITYGSSSHFGFRTIFTTTRNTWCFFDSVDVSGPGFVDVTPPTVTSVTAISASQVDVVFSENVGIATAQTAANYLLDGLYTPTSAVIQNLDSVRVRLTFAAPAVPFTQCVPHILQTSNVTDRAANVMVTDTRSFTYSVAVAPIWKSVVVSEIMSDESPAPACYPAIDYIELYNRGNDPVDLQGWTIADAATSPVITASSFLLCPGEYVLLASDTIGFPGPFKKIKVTSFPNFNSGGDPVILRTSTNFYVDSLTYTTTWYQDPVKAAGGWSLELINLDDTCTGQANWIATNDACGGTPGVQNSVYSTVIDATAPSISSLSLPGGNVVDVCFSEPVAASYLSNTANFSANNGLGTPSAATVVSSTCVSLQFGSISNGVLYTLTATNIQDCHGNNAPDSEDFLQTGPASFKAVIINEIYADPDSSVTNMPPVEYVEIHNRSNAIYDLAGWRFRDPSSVVTLSSHILQPGDYLILCKTSDTAWFTGLPYLGSTTMPSLNNTGDQLGLRDAFGTLIDSVAYTDADYQDPIKAQGGWSLELINPTDTCAVFGNWIASNDPDGGTPGAVNSVLNTTPDVTGPVLLNLTVSGNNTLDVCFDEPLAASTLLTSNFVVSGGFGSPTGVTAGGVAGECVSLTFASNFASGQLYTLTVAGVQDCKGNSGGGSAPFLLSGPAPFKAVIINEIYADPDSVPASMPPSPVEFVELFNRSGQIFDLAGWVFSDPSSSATLPSYILAPGDYLVLCRLADTAFFTGLPYLGLATWPSLNNTGDNLGLRDQVGGVVDGVNYDISWYQDATKSQGGWTLELINPTDTCVLFGNWIASVDPDGGTPGAVNSVLNTTPDVTGPALQSVTPISPNTIEVCFDEPIDPSGLVGANFVVNGGIGAATAATASGVGGECVTLAFGSNFVPGQLYTVVASNLQDCKGNAGGGTGQFIISGPAAFKSVIINEIYADPDSAATGMPPVEFVELYNRSGQLYDLVGWSFSDPSSTSILPNYLLAPGDYVVLCKASDTAWFTGLPYLGLGSLPSLNNSGDALYLGDPFGNFADSVHYNLSWYQDPSKDDGGWTLELINPQDTCSQLGNWIASNDPSGGTPGLQNSVFSNAPDLTAPLITSLDLSGSNTIDLCFNETMDAGALATAANYLVNNGIGAAITAVPSGTSGECVTLTFASAFIPGTVYTLSTTNLGDCKGNISTDTEDFLISPGAFAKDILINEIFPDPDTAATQMPISEFVELYNRSNQVYNLGGWSFADGSSKVFLGNFILNPGGYVILCANSQVGNFPGLPVLGLSSLPSLNNTGDNLGLRDQNGALIDTVDYDLSFYADPLKDDGGWSMELINPNAICNVLGNWHASYDPSGGTPGLQNSAFNPQPDTTGPLLSSITISSPFSIDVCFNEFMDVATLTTLTNYSVDNGLGGPFSAVPAGANGECVTLMFTNQIDTGVVYTLTISGLADCLGNLSGTQTGTFVQGGSSARFQIVINEIFCDETPLIGLVEAEFIELYNTGTTTVDLRDWVITDRRDDGVLGAYSIQPGEYVILCATSNVIDYSAFGTVIGVSGMPGLNNAGDSLELYDASGNLIDLVYYTDEWYHDETKTDGGWTIERKDATFDCMNADNWAASTDSRGGTPGSVNSVAASFVDQTPPSLIGAYLVGPTSLLLTFDEPMQQTPLLNPLNFTIDGGIGNPIATSASDGFPTRVVLELGTQPAPNTVFCVTVAAVRDCPGNVIGADNVACFGIPLAAEAGDILINEVLYNPYTGGNDFLEVYNHSDKIIDLASLRVCYTNDDGDIDGYDPLSDTPLLLLPGEYIAFVEANRDLLLSTYLPLDPNRVFLIDNLPTWDDDEGSVIILRDDSLLIDSLHYFKEWAFPDLSDANGVSLERHDFDRPTQDEYNWHSAASTVRYATPGYVNSEILQVGDSTDVWLTPHIFSPDLDQRDDVLSVNYNFSIPGLNAKVSVYDNRGRLVKILQQNMLLPTGETTGTITWDGTNEANVVANMGVYVIYFEATAPSTGEHFVRKLGCVLAK
jgi:hypothetical protein